MYGIIVSRETDADIRRVIFIETYYLIDYENVHGDGLSGCQDLGKNDYIVIFFTPNAKNIDMSDISDIGAAKLEMIKVPAGKQSADMHIGSYLGYLAGKNGNNCKVVIVSKDTDFDNVINFWSQKTGITASRAEQIKKKVTKKTEPNKQKSQSTNKNSVKVSGTQKTKFNQEVMQAMRSDGYDANTANKVAQIASSFYGDDYLLSEIHNELMDTYTDYLDVYATIRPVLSKYVNVKQPQSSNPTISPQTKTATNSGIQKELSKAGFTNDIIQFVASTAVKNLTVKNGKQQTYRDIISEYGQNRGLNIYNHIKKYI